MLEIPAKKTFNEDIVLVGEAIITTPCVIYSITLTNDSAIAGVANLCDYTSYSATYRFEKIAIAANSTVHLTFPAGISLTYGLYVAANTGSLDISVSYL